MIQNYTNLHPGAKQAVLQPNKLRLVLLSSLSLAFALYVTYLFSALSKPVVAKWQPLPEQAPPAMNDAPPVNVGARVDSVATVVAKALYFKSLLTTTQQATLQQTYTTTLARKWSNLPCGSGCRNGIQFSALTSAQLAAALDVIKAAAGTTANEGYDEFMQVRYADTYLKTIGGGNGYDSTIYFISFLNTPTTTGAWMLQFGGHHYAANFAYNGGRVVGATPYHMGVEPTTFTLNNVSYSPLKQEHDSFAVMLAGLDATQLATAKLTSSFSDCVMLPGESNGGPTTFPAKAGLLANTLTTTQKSLVLAAMKNYTNDLDDSTAAILQALFASKIDSTYISWTGSGTSGSSSTFLNANTNYVRLDGPRVWIEFVCQNGVVVQGQIHYHTVFRDRVNDYGKDLTSTTLPLSLLSFDAVTQGKNRLLNWTTSNEIKLGYFELQRSVNPSAGFTTVAKLNATNNSKNAYSYTDNETIADNAIYYRLNMVDANGRSTYSNVIAVKYNSTATGISLYPNPVQNVLTLSSATSVQNGTISIIDNAGKMVLRSTNRSGRNLNVDVANLPAGPYLVQLSSEGKTTTLKFVKQK